jgi:hypothetical protein
MLTSSALVNRRWVYLSRDFQYLDPSKLSAFAAGLGDFFSSAQKILFQKRFALPPEPLYHG